jgi:hypothetical protein
MSRRRYFGTSHVYGEQHRYWLPELYPRTGHRHDMCDRDWTEFCHYCKTPLALFEEERDMGRDLDDKGTSVLRGVAGRAGLPAVLFAWKVDRPVEVDNQIRELNSELLELERRYPIVGFRARRLLPTRSPLLTMSPLEWWRDIAVLHVGHHQQCTNPAAARAAQIAPGLIIDVRYASRLWSIERNGQAILPVGGG